MRDVELWVGPYTAAPQDDIEVQHTGAPPSPAPRAVTALCVLEKRKKFSRAQVAFQQRGRIGILASGWTDRRAINDS